MRKKDASLALRLEAIKMSSIENLTIKIGGIAGAGVSATTNIIARVLKEHGYKIQTLRDIPSRIRGGHTNETVRASTLPCFSMPDYIDVLIALDRATIERYLKDVREKGVLIVDTTSVKYSDDDLKGRDVVVYELPAAKLAREEFGNEIFKNTILLGALTEMLYLDKEIAEQVISRIYKTKGEKIIQTNIKALEIGAKYFREKIGKKDDFRLRKIEKTEDVLILTGNDAIALGALVAGCRFIAGYPITPATQILERLALYLPDYGGIALQAEDEISAINAAIGAAIAGARAMTSTSGPGFSLMSEAVSLAGMAEVPLVLVNSNRAGPSTGMPTKTEQSDLLFTIFQGHGEFPKIVLAPSTNEEAFYITVEAFNIADKCQCPVVIFVDEFLSHGYQTAKKFDLSKVKIDRGEYYVGETLKEIAPTEYYRYKITPTGISPRTIPYKGGKTFMVTGLEHNEYGYPIEDPEMRVKMMDKRLKKIETLLPELKEKFGPIEEGPDDAKMGIIGFGSVICAIGEAVYELEKDGIKAKVLRLRMVWPFPEDEVRDFVNRMDKVFVVEMNATGQLLKLVKMAAGPLDKIYSIRKYTGRMFKPIEIVEKIKEVM
ncbi:MAG: 2-oxoacid:acceptor oxidoreductase subunit alpha [Candidatus Njordarchaeia archaeon]